MQFNKVRNRQVFFLITSVLLFWDSSSFADVDLNGTLNWAKNSILCSDKNKCPSGIVNIDLVDNNGYPTSHCTGTLIENNWIMTNSHCIPKEIAQSGAECSKQIIVSFPALEGRSTPHVIRCKNILFVSESKNPDIAIFSLAQEPSGQTPHPTKRTHLSDGMSLHYISLDLTYYPIIRAVNCAENSICDYSSLNSGEEQKEQKSNWLILTESGSFLRFASTDKDKAMIRRGTFPAMDAYFSTALKEIANANYLPLPYNKRRAGSEFIPDSFAKNNGKNPYESNADLGWCEDFNNCPNGIARVQFSDQLCSGVLIAKDVVAIPATCLPPKDQEIPANCLEYNNHVSFSSRAGVEAERIGCLDIFYKSESSNIALIKLLRAPQFHQPLKIADSLSHNFRIFSIHHDLNTYEVHHTCKVAQKTVVGKEFNRSDFPQVTLVDCPVGPGNSGSPLLDDNGNLVAVISGQIHPSALGMINLTGRRFNFITDVLPNWEFEPIRQIGVAINLIALPPISDLASGNYYNFLNLPRINYDNSSKELPLMIMEESLKDFENFQQTNSVIKWVLKTKSWNGIPLTGPMAECYYPRANLEKFEKKIIIPLWISKINSALQMQPGIKQIKTHGYITIVPQEMEGYLTTGIKEKDKKAEFPSNPFLDYVLNECGK